MIGLRGHSWGRDGAVVYRYSCGLLVSIGPCEKHSETGRETHDGWYACGDSIGL